MSRKDLEKEIDRLILQGKEVKGKLWGYEYWIENNFKYCGKLLYLLPGFQSSLHLHYVKDETFCVLDGVVALEMPEGVELLRGWCHDAVRIPPRTAHRFWAVEEPAVVMEVSTAHMEEDVYRLEESRRI